jgi:signal transduction histidine kinase
VRSGKSELVMDIADSLLERAARDQADLALFRGLGMRSYMAAPVRARDDILGVISFVSAESGRQFGSDDLALAEDLARRAGVAIENARLYHEAQEQVALREQLLTVVAHDLRVPLTAIKGTADLLQRQAVAGRLDPNRLAEQMARISHAAAGMAANISELLDTARLRAGLPLELHPQRMDIVKIAYQVASQVQIGATRHTINVEPAVPELFGEWDAGRLERVLGNLLANSIKYSPEGGQVTVEIHREEGPRGAWACVAVRDHGVGIPAADLGRIFEPYHRAANVLGKFPGEGMGLNGARHIVELHGGSIEVASEEGQGSTFTLRLPL